MQNKYISIFEASKMCSYDQEYLSLLARRGQLQAEKYSGKWYTTVKWLNGYLKEKKPNEFIADAEKEGEKLWPFDFAKKLHWYVRAAFLTTGFFILAFLIYQFVSSQENLKSTQKDPNQIIKEEISLNQK